MMGVTIRVVGSAIGVWTPYDGYYVRGEYTPEHLAFGEWDVTDDPTKARVFADTGEATDYWQQEHPPGMGGQNFGGANRPLTFFTVQIDTVAP
jgi:hypothetical protein